MNTRICIALPALVLLVACTPRDPAATNTAMTGSDLQNMMIEDGDPSNDNDDMIPGTGSTMRSTQTDPEARVQSADYAAFFSDVLADGQPKILFFHAAWCPICRDADAQLSAWYGDRRPTIDTYKVDYDTEAELRARYGVTYQHTFVLLDGEGNVIQKVQGPSDTALQALIGA